MDKTKNILVNICPECGAEHTNIKFCSVACKNLSQKGKPAWNKDLTKEQYTKKEVVLSNRCLNCGVPVVNKYCSHSCQTAYQNKQNRGKTYDDMYGKEKAQNKRNKMSKSISKKANETHFTCVGANVTGDQRRGLKMVDFYGEEKAKQVKQDIRTSLAAFRQTPKGIEQRLATSKRGLNNTWADKSFQNTKKGYFKGVYFDSSLEESFLQECYRILGTLKNIQRNTIIISYKGISRRTIPDYSVIDNKGNLIALIECKYEYYMLNPITYLKANALYFYGQSNRLFTGYFTYGTLETFKKLQGNPDPRRLNSLLSYAELELYNYVVGRKEQRLSVEEEETNKTLKNVDLAVNVPNDPVPLLCGM